MRMLSILIAAGALSSLTQAAPLTEQFILNQNNGCCVAGPYGTVLLTQVSSTEIDFKVSLEAGDFFVQTGQAGAFAFNLDIPHPTITVSSASIAAGFSSTVLGNSSTQTEHMDAFGFFNYAIQCDASHQGGSNPMGQLLTFSVTNGSGISFADFHVDSTNGVFFAAEILSTPSGSGVTGTVATDDAQIQSITPEPATFVLAGIGLVALGFARRIPRNPSRS